MSQPVHTYNSQVVQIGSAWPGITAIRNLVIFGASYCDVKYDFETSPRPTVQDPLGVSFPGRTYAEPGKANWVGHLVTRLKEDALNYELLVYNFAHGGDTTEGLERQIRGKYLPWFTNVTVKTSLQKIFSSLMPTKTFKSPQWTAFDTLFAIWIGINDCGYWGLEEIPPRVATLFDLVELLYQRGSRSFMLIDIPPMQRSPAMKHSKSGKYSFEEWNDLLRAHASRFAESHQDATVIIFSSWDTFTRVLDDPIRFGFGEGDVKKRGGSIWLDHIHPTSRMHDEVAKDVLTLLKGIPPQRGMT